MYKKSVFEGRVIQGHFIQGMEHPKLFAWGHISLGHFTCIIPTVLDIAANQKNLNEVNGGKMIQPEMINL